MDKHMHARQPGQVATLRAGTAARTVVSTTGGSRATAFVRPFVKENEK